MNIKLADSPTFTACDAVQEICDAFFKLTQITYFNFIRIYDDNRRIFLSNNFSWTDYFFRNHKNYKLIFEEKIKNLNGKSLVWDLNSEIREDPLIATARANHNIDHGFTFLTRFHTYTEFYYFATKYQETDLNSFYINEMALLNAFVLYFKDKAHNIIQEAAEDRFQFNDHTPFWINELKEKHEHPVKQALLTACPIDRYFLDKGDDELYLTRREAECVALLFEGQSIKEIGKSLALSPRTVESYLDQVKFKFDCDKKSSLLQKAQQYGFMDLYPVIKAVGFQTKS